MREIVHGRMQIRKTFSRSARREQRAAAIDPRIDTDTGEFQMIMASEGEASDGHILSIAGGQMPAEMPLQLDHSPRALSNLGTVRNIRREKADGLAVFKGVGQVRLTGDGEPLEARRDLVDAISRGDVKSVSLTWDSLKATERRDLPPSHFAHVKRDEANPRKRFGLFFERWEGIEQSIVGIGSDREALIGRSEHAGNDTSREMWNSLLQRLDAAPRSRESEIIDALEKSVRDLEERLRGAEAHKAASDTDPEPPPELELVLDAFARQVASDGARGRRELADRLEDVISQLG